MYGVWMQDHTQNGSRTWKDHHLAPSICTSPFYVAQMNPTRAAPQVRERAMRAAQEPWDTHHFEMQTPIIKGVVPKGTCPLHFSGSAQQTALQIIGMSDRGTRWGNIHWHSQWRSPPDTCNFVFLYPHQQKNVTCAASSPTTGMNMSAYSHLFLTNWHILHNCLPADTFHT